MKTTLFNFSKVISTVKYVGAVAVFVTGLAAFSGCAKKGCTESTADNFDADATEDDGSCIDAGTKFAGSYKYNEPNGTGCGGFTDWPATVTVSSTAGNKVIITGFGALQCNGADIAVEGTVVGQDITIANQSFCSSNVSVSSGSGTMNSGNTSFTINYTYTVQGTSATCSGTYTKL